RLEPSSALDVDCDRVRLGLVAGCVVGHGVDGVDLLVDRLAAAVLGPHGAPAAGGDQRGAKGVADDGGAADLLTTADLVGIGDGFVLHRLAPDPRLAVILAG